MPRKTYHTERLLPDLPKSEDVLLVWKRLTTTKSPLPHPSPTIVLSRYPDLLKPLPATKQFLAILLAPDSTTKWTCTLEGCDGRFYDVWTRNVNNCVCLFYNNLNITIVLITVRKINFYSNFHYVRKHNKIILYISQTRSRTHLDLPRMRTHYPAHT